MPFNRLSPGRGIRGPFRIEEGDPVGEIVRLADEASVDLLVTGTHGRSGFQRLFLGSVAEKVQRLVRCPVLTVPPAEASPVAATFKTILCAIDFGPSANRALDYAFSLAREADARVILLHVVESYAELTSLGDTAGFSLPDHQRALERESLARLAALVPAEAWNWSRPETLVVSGKGHREIVRVAQETRADLIVMGMQGRGAVDLLLFGSTTHHVIRQAACPVLTVCI